MPLILRPATLADVPLLRQWDELPHVVASDPNDDWDWENELANGNPGWHQLMAEVDGVPIGFVQMLDPALDDTQYWGPMPHGIRAIDIWIGPADYLGKGYGTQMMQLALAQCFADPAVTMVLIDPLETNHDAIRFYRRLGFQYVETRRFGQDVCAVHQLTRQVWESAFPF